MSRVHTYTVVSSEMITNSTLSLVLRDEHERQPMTFLPGQYAAISFLNRRRPTPARCFSIASSPTEQGMLRFGIKVQGTYTQTAVQALVPGAEVIVEGPFGDFIFNPEQDKSALLLAGGIGVTPFISILRYAALLDLANDLMLVYSCRSQDDIPYLAELVQLMNEHPRLHVMFVISSGSVDKLAGLNIVQGHVDGTLLDMITSGYYAGRSYMICGPTGFMHNIADILEAKGASPDAIMTEAFSQGQHSPKSLRANLPLQVYALTGLSLVLGSSAILLSDVAQPTVYASNSSGSSGQTVGDGLNSRQDDVNQTINQLSGNTDSSGSAGVTNGSGSNAATNSNSVSTSGDTGTNRTSASSSSGNSTGSSGSSSSGSSGSGNSNSSGTSSGSSSFGSKSPTPTKTPSPTTTPVKTPTPTSTPAPTQPPAIAPSLSFSASSTSITDGDSVNLYWNINGNATAPVSCSASGGWSGSKSTNGSTTVHPSSTTTYRLSCSNSAGTSSRSVTINVQPACVSTASQPC